MASAKKITSDIILAFPDMSFPFRKMAAQPL